VTFWKKVFLSFAIIIVILFISIIGFLWWNHYPPLPLFSEGIIKQVAPVKGSAKSLDQLCVVTYNIHFGIGYDWKRKDALHKQGFIQRLDRIAKILVEADADIVCLQEVDFDSQRTQRIDQAEHIAKKAGFAFVAKATHLRERFHPSIQGLHGPIDHGICVLSKFPITQNQVTIFPHPKEVPFYLRWIFTPHGMQEVKIKHPKGYIHVFNAHLEPWSQRTREAEIEKMVALTKQVNTPIIIAGDFNTIPPETPKKMGFHMNDAPWFIDPTKWDIENESTIKTLRALPTISEAIPPKQFLADEKASCTFPALDPIEKLDYIFALNGLKITKGFVFHAAKTASDHLPLVAYLVFYPANIPPISMLKTNQ